MKTIDSSEADPELSDYARKGPCEALVVTRRGKPVLAVTPLSGTWESVAVANSLEFQALIEL